jgi:hypothetical protein
MMSNARSFCAMVGYRELGDSLSAGGATPREGAVMRTGGGAGALTIAVRADVRGKAPHGTTIVLADGTRIEFAALCACALTEG